MIKILPLLKNKNRRMLILKLQFVEYKMPETVTILYIEFKFLAISKHHSDVTWDRL